MLIFLQLAALNQLALYMLKILYQFDYYKKDVYKCVKKIFGQYYLFLELAALMNIAKWIYFFLVVQTHRNIRHYEINMDIYAEREGNYSKL